MDHNWGHSSRYPGAVPPMAVVGGHDSDGSTIYVGRAMYQGDNLPAKVVPCRNEAYVSWGGNEIVIRNYEILCGQNYRWVPCAHGQVPYNAVRSGSTATGEPLYIGRGHWQGSLTVGKIHPSHHCLYIPYGGREHRLDSYEVLIFERGDTWTSVYGGQIPPGAVVGGHDSDGGFHHNWVHSCIDGPLPELAVVGGHDSDGTTLFVGRAHHDGDLIPVKINPSNRSAYTCCEGYEIFKEHYEVLCGTGYSWMVCENGYIPGNAVSCGRTNEGEIVYIGRGHFDRSLTVGKVFRGDDCLYIPYGGKERRVRRYEVLIRDSYVVPAQTCETTYTTTYTKYEPGSYVVPADTTSGYVIPAKTGGCEPGCGPQYVVPAQTGGGQFVKPGGYVVPARTGGNYDQPPAYEKTPSYAGGLYPSAASTPSVSPPPNIAGCIKNEPYSNPSPGPGQVTPYPPPPPMGFVAETSSPYPPAALSYPPITHASPTITPNPINTAATGSVMPMPMAPPPYEAEVKEEVAVVHKKPPNFGFQVLPPLPPPYKKELEDENNVIWIKWKSDNVPRDAIYAGVDTDLSTLYVGRCFHNGDLLPAKVNISKACAYISFNGHEVLKEDYELLTGTGFEWIPSHDGYVPQDAVIGGRTAGGETLYIGRGHHMESITPGKIQPSENCLYIPFGGGEVKLQNYEVLVKRNGKILNM